MDPHLSFTEELRGGDYSKHTNIDKLENSTSSFTQQYESSSSSVSSNFYSKYVINKSSFLSSISVKNMET